MGGNSGVIIIRSLIRPAGESAAVQDSLSAGQRLKLQDILAKSDGNWTDKETRFVLRKIAEAYDEQC